MAEKPILSVLVCSVPTRLKGFRVIEELCNQAKKYPCEVLYLGDNHRMTVGEKRNWLRTMATGKFITYVDDDDRVSDDYVALICTAAATNPKADLIVFDAEIRINAGRPKRVIYGTSFHIDEETPDAYLRRPNHLMAWRSEILPSAPFTSISYGEDANFATDMVKRTARSGLNQVRIPHVLYYYDFNQRTTEAQKRV